MVLKREDISRFRGMVWLREPSNNLLYLGYFAFVRILPSAIGGNWSRKKAQ